MFNLWENLIKNREYIENILNFLEEKPYLGMLVPPAPYHGEYFHLLGDEWTSCFEKTERLAKQLSLQCKLTQNCPPLTLGTAFWCKTEALSPLICYEWREEDFPEEPLASDNTINHAIERIFSYVAQSRGYATGIVMNEEYASIQYNNYSYMLRNIIKKERSSKWFPTYHDYIHQDNYYDFKMAFAYLKQFSRIFIYGIGVISDRVASFFGDRMQHICGFIVSDGYRKQTEHQGKPVYELSEIIPDKNTGVIIALDKTHTQEVLPELERRGFQNICR